MSENHDAVTAPRTGATSKTASGADPASAADAAGAAGAKGTAGAKGAAGTTGSTPDVPDVPNGPTFPVLPPSEQDELTHRLRHAVSGFVDAPRDAVEEADLLLDELSTRLTALLTDRRRTLRDAWCDDGAGTASGTAPGAVGTEELRLAMRGYRNVLERLLSV
jgi:hypothetical protein